MTRKNNRLTTVSTALVPEEVKKIKELAQAKSLTVSELFREGMQWYLANQDKLTTDSRESVLEKRMRKMEDRLASLMARTAIDVGTIFSLMYRNVDRSMSEKERDEMMTWAYNVAVARLKKKLEGQAADVKEAMQALDVKDSSQTQLRKG